MLILRGPASGPRNVSLEASTGPPTLPLPARKDAPGSRRVLGGSSLGVWGWVESIQA